MDGRGRGSTLVTASVMQERHSHHKTVVIPPSTIGRDGDDALLRKWTAEAKPCECPATLVIEEVMQKRISKILSFSINPALSRPARKGLAVGLPGLTQASPSSHCSQLERRHKS